MEKKNSIASILGILVIAIIITCAEYSCKIKTIAATPMTKWVVMQIPVHDTIKPKPITEAEKQALVDKFYKYGYDKYYGPKFERMEAIINKQATSLQNQANSIHNLTGIMASMRDHSISVRDSLNKVQDSTQKDNAYWKSLAIKNAQENSRNLKIAADNSSATTLTNKENLKLLSIVTGLIIISMIFLYKKVSKFEINLAELRKEILTHE